jgi:hypothetical protein
LRDQGNETAPSGEAAAGAARPAVAWCGLRRPMIKPGLRRLRRDGTTVQLGIDPDRAVLVTGLDTATRQWLERLDGSRERAGLLGAAHEAGVSDEDAASLLGLLSAHGLLDDAAADCRTFAALPDLDRERLRPDLASLSLVHSRPDGGRNALAGRLAATVEVRGGGRVGASAATLLAAAGVGRVLVTDHEQTRPTDLAPAGLGVDDLGAARGYAAARAARRAGPAGPRRPRRSGDARAAPDLVLLALEDPVRLEVRDALIAAHVPHLVAGVRETTGVVGPLVLPGRSSCLMCHDLTRADRDPAWPQLAAQLATEPSPLAEPRRIRPCDAVLATAVASHAVLQALSYLDGGTPSTVDGTLEIGLPEGTIRRRSWHRHPACGCAWADPDGP